MKPLLLQNKFVKTLCGSKEGTGKACPFFKLKS
jgi:hypothetical protein